MGNSPYLDNLDPDDSKWYAIDWSNELTSSESIGSATWTVPAGLSQAGTAISDNQTQVQLTGGTAGVTYTITCQMFKNTGESITEAIYVEVEDVGA